MDAAGEQMFILHSAFNLLRIFGEAGIPLWATAYLLMAVRDSMAGSSHGEHGDVLSSRGLGSVWRLAWEDE